MINVRAWNQTGPVLKQLRVRGMTPQNVVLQIHIVRKDNGTDPSFTRAAVDTMIARANTIWAQAGIRSPRGRLPVSSTRPCPK